MGASLRNSAARILVRAACGLLALAVAAAPAGEHPALLLSLDELPRLRHAFGAGEPQVGRSFGPFAARRDALRAIERRALALTAPDAHDAALESGDIAALAFAHSIGGPTDKHWLERLNRALREPLMLGDDSLELVLALDWCWDAIAPDVRRDFLINVRAHNKPLRPADSPLDHRPFRERLTVLAACILFDEQDEPSSGWREFRTPILAAAREWAAAALPGYLAQRGRIPSTPAAAADEECDTALAIELLSRLTGDDLWARHAGELSRWMEHYLYTAGRWQFVRDDGDAAPGVPWSDGRGLRALTAPLLAARLRDPVAAWLVDRQRAALQSAPAETAIWAWSCELLDIRDVPRVDSLKRPIARNLDGAVVFSALLGGEPLTVWVDAGQRFLRPRAHLDAGHFLVDFGGDGLVAGACEDVLLDSAIGVGGQQRLGRSKDSFDLDQYLAATVAHNCMLFTEPLRVLRWRGRRYTPLGGQSPVDEPARNFAAPTDAAPLRAARLIAYGACDTAAYAAIELGRLYDDRDVERYTREFLFLDCGVLLVVDRARTSGARVTPTWIVNTPSRPRVDEGELPDARRIAGSDNTAGVWRCDAAKWVEWSVGEHTARLASLAPAPHKLLVVGGPARRIAVEDDVGGRTYVGGDAGGFERLIGPGAARGAMNVWYRLGPRPHASGELLQQGRWGRVEIEPAREATERCFASLLSFGNSGRGDRPAIHWREDGGALVVEVALDAGRRTIQLPLGLERGGEVRLGDGTTWALPEVVSPDPPLATVPTNAAAGE